MAVALLTVSVLPSFAADTEYLSKDSFWNWIAGKGGIVQKVTGYLPGTGTCTQSDDGYHHSTSAYRVSSDGSHFLCVCDYCGKDFSAYESDLQQSYEQQVAELPAMGYTSDGGLLFTLEHKGMGIEWQSTGYCCDHASSSPAPTLKATFNCDSNAFSVVPASGYTSIPDLRTLYVEFWSIAPISGFYAKVKGTPQCKYTLVALDGTSTQDSLVYEGNTGLGTRYEAGASISATSWATFSRIPVASAQFQGFSPVYKITPDASLSSTTYNITSRPTSITGDYGIIGDNGQIIKVEGDKIVNETNNTYYNPSTGETTTITDWSYNYEDRSYTVTTEAGDTVTITYGDENVVIKEGDTTYNIYYLVDGSGSENPGPGPGTCNHQWAETSTTPATCTVPGSRLLTCSLCNETKTETIPAPGHKWTIKQEVKNEYDSSGNQTQEGYTIWECSVCGEQQKTTDGTAPPGGGSGTGSGSSGGVFSGIFGLLVDFLGFFFNTFRDFVGEGVKGFLNALMDGTSSIFGLLNPFNWGG